MKELSELPERELLTLDEVCHYFRVHRNTLGRWIKEGALPCTRTPGGQVRIKREDVVELLKHSSP